MPPPRISAGSMRWSISPAALSFETVAEGDPKTWQRMYALNVLTALNASQSAIPHLTASGSGRIVNVGAMGALQAGAGMGPYAASKAGVHRLTETMAAEFKGKITVNAVLPSTIDTADQPREHAEGGFRQMGAAAGTRRGDPVPGQRCRQRGDRRAVAGERTGVTSWLSASFAADLIRNQQHRRASDLEAKFRFPSFI